MRSWLGVNEVMVGGNKYKAIFYIYMFQSTTSYFWRMGC